MMWLELFFVAMALKFLTHLGMLPDRLLWERSKIWSEVKAQSWSGMWPWKLFARKLRIIKLENLCPIQEGMCPTNSFSATSIVTNFSQFFNENGSFPENLLLYRCKDLRRVKDPMDVGMLPVKLLFPKFRATKLFHFIQQLGIFPDKRFLSRLRSFICLGSFILKHRKWEIDLENEFLERSSTFTLEDIKGNDPLKWFELRSITELEDQFMRLFTISP